ncbi:hypothetical protein Mp_3g01190 [Marchantia polymorpha subsp. ruderalis]|uniref:Uncharacterized protein n=2 Tax=Marchantia polymorpha TaxID=3197 RepID=A0AAF6AW85_MARPO|nr:hypothetical protein MARPO_0007s0113 [Marchantia polymorpha]BBN04019.1 hypothetical protein Mp_3g01190 [Marchantia polymorpha subsp. ruderalis]|eukprot:PTQ47706.1 hypothetical protein MARPO_0007s0113 [Marchantia polymorpha]
MSERDSLAPNSTQLACTPGLWTWPLTGQGPTYSASHYFHLYFNLYYYRYCCPEDGAPNLHTLSALRCWDYRSPRDDDIVVMEDRPWKGEGEGSCRITGRKSRAARDEHRAIGSQNCLGLPCHLGESQLLKRISPSWGRGRIMRA